MGDGVTCAVPAGLETGNAKVAEGTGEGADEVVDKGDGVTLGDEARPGVEVGVGEGGIIFSQ